MYSDSWVPDQLPARAVRDDKPVHAWAADIVKQQGNYRDPADYGTKVHLELKKKVDAEGDPDFIAETSFVNGKPANYGEKGSIRTDVLENIRERKTVCFYDIKTGQQGLGFPRTVDIAKAYKAFPGTLRVIVTEVRPSR